MVPTIWYAANEGRQQKQPRKLLIVITDGTSDDEATTKDVIDRLRCRGFELLWVGIETDSVTQLFANNVALSSLSELKQALFNKLSGGARKMTRQALLLSAMRNPFRGRGIPSL